MLKNLFLFCFVVSMSSNLQAQFGFGKIEDINALKERTLLVEMKEPSEKTLKKLRKKPKELQAYKQAVINYNDGLKKVFNKEWNMSKDVEFVSLDRINEVSNDKKLRKQYAYFKAFIRTKPLSSSMGSIPMYTYNVGLLENRKPIYTTLYSSFNGFSEADAIIVTNLFENYFKNRVLLKTSDKSRRQIKKEFKQKVKILKTKTLYIDKEFVTDRLIRKIKDIYNYDYKLVDNQEMEKAIVNKTEDVVYVKSIPVSQTSQKSGALKVSKEIYMQYFFDADNGEIVTYSRPSANLGVIGDSGLKLSVKDLKKISKNIEK